MRTNKKTKKKQLPRRLESLDVVHRSAAGIDIGSRSHYVAVSPGLCDPSVREFSALTSGLVELVEWLKDLGVTTVAMESTGVYWVPLYEMLQSAGIDVQLVNARHVRSVPGRKTDVLDCQWLLTLHTFGLLRGSFRPTAEIVTLRSYLRQRDTLVRCSAEHVQHMQKALTLMNLQLHTVVTDITGTTGISIIRAIAAGERDPAVLAKNRDPRCKASHQTIVESLTGNYRPDHLFVLGQSLRLYDTYQELIAESDQHANKLLDELTESLEPPAPLPRGKRRGPKQPKVDYRTPAYKLFNVDLTAIPGISEYTAVCLLSEIGADMSRWPTLKHFAAWLRLAPGSKITGGKSLSSRILPTVNRATQLLRTAAVNVGRTRTALGAFYRRLCAKEAPVPSSPPHTSLPASSITLSPPVSPSKKPDRTPTSNDTRTAPCAT
jgi:transposase